MWVAHIHVGHLNKFFLTIGTSLDFLVESLTGRAGPIITRHYVLPGSILEKIDWTS